MDGANMDLAQFSWGQTCCHPFDFKIQVLLEKAKYLKKKLSQLHTPYHPTSNIEDFNLACNSQLRHNKNTEKLQSALGALISALTLTLSNLTNTSMDNSYEGKSAAFPITLDEESDQIPETYAPNENKSWNILNFIASISR